MRPQVLGGASQVLAGSVKDIIEAMNIHEMTNHDKDVLACLKVEMRALMRGAVVSRPITEFAR